MSDYNVNIVDAGHHDQIRRRYSMVTCATAPEGYWSRSQSDVAFLKLNPAAGGHCGLTKVVLQGTLKAVEWYIGGPGTGPIPVWDHDIGNISITVCIPWFLRG